MIAWQVARHRVGIAGRVTDAETGKPIPKVAVTMTEMPTAFKRMLKSASTPYGNRWSSMVERLDKTLTRADGLFYFLDLPSGKYTLSASLPGSGKRYGVAQAAATVTHDAQGGLKMAMVSLVLQPTTVKGKVTGPGHKNGVVLAEVRVKGSGERVFSDAQGQYVLAGIEPGKRTVMVFAQGYQPASHPVLLGQSGALETLNFALVREAS
jgi:hypothetical protein